MEFLLIRASSCVVVDGIAARDSVIDGCLGVFVRSRAGVPISPFRSVMLLLRRNTGVQAVSCGEGSGIRTSLV